MRFLQVVAVFASVSSLWAMPAAGGEEILLRQDLLDAVNNQREHENQIVAGITQMAVAAKNNRDFEHAKDLKQFAERVKQDKALYLPPLSAGAAIGYPENAKVIGVDGSSYIVEMSVLTTKAVPIVDFSYSASGNGGLTATPYESARIVQAKTPKRFTLISNRPLKPGDKVTFPCRRLPMWEGTRIEEVQEEEFATAVEAIKKKYAPKLYAGPQYPLSPDVLYAGKDLTPGKFLASTDGRFSLILQENGNLSLIRLSDNSVKWETKTSGKQATRCTVTDNGTLSLLDAQNRTIWTSGNRPGGGAFLYLQTDGNLVIYRESEVLWASNTSE